ncbi:GPI inositol-deacylase isoform X2 [Cyprinodon tularosa]|uniref:GPI inositol-deacylase isoform X2 n=1 Tax=Cyprinodon tularosa TaxID=77115 RepID=UPI0018E23C0D|nr:GPI inositol-deacylase isoform X2 [Cyprinodon tularosa]
MKTAAVAFYGAALVLLLAALKELLTGFEENRCSMTYMFEQPEYRRVVLPRRVSRLFPAYGLYLYGEGVYAQETRNLKLSGTPVLFLPGNAGSYKQARSLGSVALRKAENMEAGLHLNVFTVDFNEELVAFYGGSLLRQTHFLHECIKAVLRLYKNLKVPPRNVALVGHSMGGVVARALFTLPRFNPRLVSLIVTQASPHVAPVLALDPYLLEFYVAVRQKWSTQAQKLRNVTVLSVGGGYRDYQVRSGLTSLPCPPGDPNKLALVATAVPRTWLSTDHLSIVWCKELVLATVRALFDLVDPETRQLTDDPERKRAVLNHHFVRHPARTPQDAADPSVSMPDVPEAWSEVNTLRLSYRTPKEGQLKYFLFALSSRRRAYSHFYCRSSSLESSSWVLGCVRTAGSSCASAVDLSSGTELLPPYKVLVLSLSDLSSFTHLVVSASNLSGKQFTVECEWQREAAQTLSVSVPHLLSFGFSVGEVTVNSSGLLHQVQLLHFHQVYQAFRISVVSSCRGNADRLPSVYRLRVPWFREDSFTTASVPSASEISGMLHTSRPGNFSNVLLQLHTAPNCQYKVSIRTSFPKVLGQVLRFCGPMVPVYTAVTLLLACRGQLCSILRSGRAADMMQVVSAGLQPHQVLLPVYLLHVLLSCSCLQDISSVLGLPPEDTLPPTFPDGVEGAESHEEWPHLLSPLLYVLGAAVAFWGSALLRLLIRLVSLFLAPLHRPSVSRTSGTLSLQTQFLLGVCLYAAAWMFCGALAIFTSCLLHLYRVLRLQMTERSLGHMLNLAPNKRKVTANGAPEAEPQSGTSPRGGAPLLSEGALQEVRDDLQLHLSLMPLLILPVMLSAPSLIHWSRNLRFSTRLDPDPWWLHSVMLASVYLLLINATVSKLSIRLLPVISRLPLPLAVTMATFSSLHLYRLAYFLEAVLVPLAFCFIF